MNAESLKSSILQLAIQGKLVEQREEEGTGEELFEKIKTEKEEMIKQKLIRKEKPFAEIMSDEIPYEIPSNWIWVRFGDLGSYRKGPFGSALKKSLFVPKGKNTVKVYEQKNAIYKDVNIGEYYITQDYFEDKMKNFELATGDVIVSCAGTIGETYVMPEKFERGIINQALMQMKLMPSLNIDYFLMYFDFILKKTAREKSKGSAIKNIPPFAELKNYLVPIPPLAEQKRIVERIEELMPYVERYGKAYEEVTELNKNFPVEMEKSILQYAIQGKLVEQRDEEGTAEDLYKQIQLEKEKLIEEGKARRQKKLPEIKENEIPFDIPDTWKWVRLGEIGETNIGLTYKKSDISESGTTVLRSSNIQNGFLDYNDIVKVSSDVPENKMCEVGDILICARNGSKRLVGKAALINKSGMSFGAFMAIYRSICNYYLLYVINSSYFRKTMLPDAGTTTINQITQGRLRNLAIPLPPLAEQRRIVARIEELLEYTGNLKEE